MTTQDYLNAFDHWLSQHICAANKAGKDLAFRDRYLNCAFKLDEDGAAWDYLLLEPGAAPPNGHPWSVYRLQGVTPSAAPAEPQRPVVRQRRRALLSELAEAVFGLGRSPEKAADSNLRAVS